MLFVSLASATNASSSSYNIEKFSTGISGSNASSSSYSLVTITSNSGSSNFSSTTYQGSSDPFTSTNASTDSGSSTPTSSVSSSGGSGGSGGSSGGEIIAPKAARGFSVSPEQLSVSLTQGEVATQTFVITNKKNTQTDFNIQTKISEGLILIEESHFALNPGESKEILVDFIAREDISPNLYLGKIIVKGGDEQTEILVSINVESKGALLDVRAEIPKGYQGILPGDELLANINMFNLGISKRADINLKYVITDFNGKIIFTKNETLAIETQTSFVSVIDIPQDVLYGKYVLYVEANYEGKVASSTANFEIVENAITQNEKIFIGIIIILVMLLSLGIYYYLKEKYPKRKFKKKIDLVDLIKGE